MRRNILRLITTNRTICQGMKVRKKMVERVVNEATLTVRQARGMTELMELGDNDLLDLVMRRAETPDEQLRGLVEKLRAS